MAALSAAGAALARAVRAELAGGGVEVAVEAVASRPWASATFAGERHVLRLRVGGTGAAAAVDRFLDGLGEREFELRGHILADIAAVSRRSGGDGERLELEALTVEAG